MAAFGDDKEAGGNFPEASHSATTPTTSHPLEDVVPSISPLSEPSLQVITPRPHLFSSLEEAHMKITSQSREGSRQVSGETGDSESRDDSFLMSLSPTDARAIYTNVGFPIIRTVSRSLTETPRPTGWGVQAAQAAPRSATGPSPGLKAKHPNMAGYGCKGTIGHQTAPNIPLPKDPPFHPSNPFATNMAHPNIAESSSSDITTPSPQSSYSPRPLLDISDSEDDNARIGASDLGVESEAEAENRLSVLQPPPERMHSARRQGHGRRSFTNSAHMSASRTTMGESDNDDPFKYDGIFPEPSREREVSLYLHQVSGFGQDEAAFTNSPDRTPLGSICQPYNGEVVSPTEQRLLRSVRSVNMAPAQGFGHNTSQPHFDSPSRGHDFFESSAINPEWALGSPDAVRVPVRQRNFVGHETSHGGAHTGAIGEAQQLVFEDLRREFGTSAFKQCGSSIANYSDCDMPSEAASIRSKVVRPYGGVQESSQQQGIGLFATQRSLVHPPGNNIDPHGTRYRQHNINQAPVPVFVPEQRTHRINGLFQNSSRPSPEVNSFKPENKKRSPSFGQMVSGAIRQPFRRGSSKRPPLPISTLHEGRPHRHPFTELDSEDGHVNIEHGIELNPIAAQPDMTTQGHAPPDRQAQIPPAAVLPPPLRMPQAHFDNRYRGDSLESSASASLFDPGRVELLPLDVAQRMQALRRASGQEDQTLTGRERLNSMRNASYTTDASQAGSQPATPSSAVTPNTGKVKRFVPRAFAHFSSPLSGRNEDDTDGALIAADDTRPTISTVTGSDVTITTIHNEDGSQYRVFDPAPRLYPWDHRHRRAATQKSTDKSLQRMAYRGLNNPIDMERGTVSRRARNTEHWLSDEAQARRRGFFLIIALLGLFPFVSLLAIAGTLDGALSWHTRGEVDHFTSRQKSFLLAEFLIMMMAVFAVIFFIAFALPR
ncbi:hypothetical protein VPNG_10208 [Cytospora leucostoma]|uniref:Uncharacterized protein n=1 Tax=Cytospora leucostoma TaxID=1230097 RepID=A0A423VDW0_9PEZI|nr:hypothetical protein VPNG_10208 [Cytospora leucostoma]